MSSISESVFGKGGGYVTFVKSKELRAEMKKQSEANLDLQSMTNEELGDMFNRNLFVSWSKRTPKMKEFQDAIIAELHKRIDAIEASKKVGKS